MEKRLFILTSGTLAVGGDPVMNAHGLDDFQRICALSSERLQENDLILVVIGVGQRHKQMFDFLCAEYQMDLLACPTLWSPIVGGAEYPDSPGTIILGCGQRIPSELYSGSEDDHHQLPRLLIGKSWQTKTVIFLADPWFITRVNSLFGRRWPAMGADPHYASCYLVRVENDEVKRLELVIDCGELWQLP